MYTGRIFFDEAGNHRRNQPYHWTTAISKQNFIFKDKLELTAIRRNEARWKSLNTGRTYTSFIGDLAKFVKHMNGGIIEGFFTFRANGSYTSLIPTAFTFEDHTVPQTVTGTIKLKEREGIGKLYINDRNGA